MLRVPTHIDFQTTHSQIVTKTVNLNGGRQRLLPTLMPPLLLEHRGRDIRQGIGRLRQMRGSLYPVYIDMHWLAFQDFYSC